MRISDWSSDVCSSDLATYGRRQDDENLDASLYYRLGPKTTLTASYREALETSQQRAISNLGNLIIDPDTGELIDEDTSQPLDEDDPFSFEDETTRTRTLRLGATHQSGRDTVGLAAFAGTNEGGSEGDEEFYQARLTWGRPLTPVARSEERRVGQEGVSTGRSRGWP